MILDGVVNPNRVFYRAFLDQARRAREDPHASSAWVASYPGVFHLGRSKAAVDRAYQRLHRDSLRAQPRPTAGSGPTSSTMPCEPAVYGTTPSWQEWPRRCPPWRTRGAPLGSSGSTGMATRWAGRRQLPRRRPGHRVHRREMAARSGPPGGAMPGASTGRLPSTRGPTPGGAHRAGPGQRLLLTRVAVSSAGLRRAPILMLNETQDGATPYAGALAARRIWPSAALVAGVGGTTHAAGLSGIACTDNAIADMLRDGSLPTRKPGKRADKECKPVPRGRPTRPGMVPARRARAWCRRPRCAARSPRTGAGRPGCCRAARRWCR